MNQPSTAFPIHRAIPFALLFLFIFSSLHFLYSNTRDTLIEDLLIDSVTVAPGVWIINLFTPDVAAQAVGPKIKSSKGSLTVLNGCEGFETIFLLVAAILAYKSSWLNKLKGVLLGTLMIYLLNQVRIVSLFYLFLSDRKLFNLVHGYIGPAIIILIGSLFFMGWISLTDSGHGNESSDG